MYSRPSNRDEVGGSLKRNRFADDKRTFDFWLFPRDRFRINDGRNVSHVYYLALLFCNSHSVLIRVLIHLNLSTRAVARTRNIRNAQKITNFYAGDLLSIDKMSFIAIWYFEIHYNIDIFLNADSTFDDFWITQLFCLFCSFPENIWASSSFRVKLTTILWYGESQSRCTVTCLRSRCNNSFILKCYSNNGNFFLYINNRIT